VASTEGRDLGPLGLAEHASDLIALAEHERRVAPVIFFGHSYGGVVAARAALERPEIVELVINYESPYPWVLPRQSSAPELSDNPEVEAERFFRRMVSNSAWERLSEIERDSRRRDGRALLNDLQVLRSGRVEVDLTQLRRPMTYIYGDGAIMKYYAALAETLRSLNSLISVQSLTSAPHGAHLSNPDVLARLISEIWSSSCASV
jgi:pimeloyl-ACP methyl ester carboxylesterase